jgi:chromosome segregation ATPase
MSKDLKDLIDSVDYTNKAHSDLEIVISRLTEEVQRLNFTIDEQKIIIQNQKTNLSEFKENNIPEDIIVLKDLITNQRQDIIKKDKDIEILQQTIADISNEFENAQTFQEENEELIYANKVIVQLTEENETNRLEIENLNNKIKELHEQHVFKEEDIGEENQDLINAKKLIFQLTEENGISRVQIESLKQETERLKTNLQENDTAKSQYIHELDEANKIIDQLTFDTDQYHEKVNYLKQKIEETVKFHEQTSPESVEIDDNLEEVKEGNLFQLEVENTELKDIINTNISIIESLKQKIEEFLTKISERDEELEKLNVKFQKIENANKQLSDLIVELKVREDQVFDSTKTIITPDQIVFENLPPTLFFKMYKQLTNDSKDIIVAQLVDDLSRSNRDLRTYAIKVLSFIKGPKVFDAFKGLVKDEDWIVKLYLIKALQNFENIEKVDMLKELQRDNDIDVREAAIEMLSKSSC